MFVDAYEGLQHHGGVRHVDMKSRWSNLERRSIEKEDRKVLGSERNAIENHRRSWASLEELAQPATLEGVRAHLVDSCSHM